MKLPLEVCLSSFFLFFFFPFNHLLFVLSGYPGYSDDPQSAPGTTEHLVPTKTAEPELSTPLMKPGPDMGQTKPKERVKKSSATQRHSGNPFAIGRMKDDITRKKQKGISHMQNTSTSTSQAPVLRAPAYHVTNVASGSGSLLPSTSTSRPSTPDAQVQKRSFLLPPDTPGMCYLYILVVASISI